MTYYTIEFSDGFTNWIHKNTTSCFTNWIHKNNTSCICKYNTFEEARDAAELLLKCPGVTKYIISKFQQEVIRSIEK